MTGQTSSSFPAIRRPASKSRRVADHILDLLRLGALEVGARLPSERELTELLGVSRTVVREALSALQLSGIVERRAGDGTYVRSTTAALTAANARPVLDDIEASTSLMQVLDAREVLDQGVARLAIENAEAESLRRLDEVLRQMEEALSGARYDQYIHLTLDFHEVLAHAAGNPYLEEVVKSLVGITRQYVWVLERNYSPLVGQRSLEVHRSIANAIHARDQEALTRAVRRHYEEYPTLGNVRDRS